MLKKLLTFALVAVSSAVSTAAPLILDSKTVGYQYVFPNQSSAYFNGPNIVIGSGVERTSLYSGGDFANIDLSTGYLDVTFYDAVAWSPAAFNGFRIYDVLNTLDAITSVTVNGATSSSGLFNVTFDSDNIYVNWQGSSFNPRDFIRLDINSVATNETPEPVSLALFGMALAGLAVVRRRKI